MLNLERVKRELAKAREEHDKGQGYYWVGPRGKKMSMGVFTLEYIEALIALAEAGA
jgi:hypothetical protein